MSKKIVALAVGAVVVLWVVVGIFNWLGSAASLAQKELSPQAMLTKYEWFKDTSNVLSAKVADIEMYEIRQEAWCKGAIDRIQIERCTIWGQEHFGVKASYNSLVAEYNSQASKFNWGMFNTENIPTSYQRK